MTGKTGGVDRITTKILKFCGETVIEWMDCLMTKRRGIRRPE